MILPMPSRRALAVLGGVFAAAVLVACRATAAPDPPIVAAPTIAQPAAIARIEVGELGGDPGGYLTEEIDRAVRARAGVFRACYQKELDRTPNLAGKVVVRFTIDGATGTVTRVSASFGTLNAELEGCLMRNIRTLRFPVKDVGFSTVSYPFVFSAGP